MPKRKPKAQLVITRNRFGRGWTDLLENQIAIMEALIKLIVSIITYDKIKQMKEHLNERIESTKDFLGSNPDL